MNLKKTNSEKFIKKTFIFFLFFLPFQYGIVGLVGLNGSEPWPAFVFPGFKNVYTSKSGVSIEKTYFQVKFINGKSKSVKPSKLFKNLQRSQIQGFIRTNLKKKKLNNESKLWIRNRVKHLFPNRQILGLNIKWHSIIYVKRDKTIQKIKERLLRSLEIRFTE